MMSASKSRPMGNFKMPWEELEELRNERDRLGQRYAKQPNPTLEGCMTACDELISERMEYRERRRDGRTD